MRIYGADVMTRKLKKDFSPLESLDTWRCGKCGELLVLYTDGLKCTLRCLRCKTPPLEFWSLTSAVEWLLTREDHNEQE